MTAGPDDAAAAWGPERDDARRLDAEDPLGHFRSQFVLPTRDDGRPKLYFCGNSLGLMPRAARAIVQEELDAWAQLGVLGHFHGTRPWLSYHEQFREGAAHVVGALPGEVVIMNSLTVNLHLMMASFYRPTPERHRILIEEPAFPSDRYAVASQLRWHGYDPAEALVFARPREGEDLLRMDDVEALIEREGPRLALVLLGALNFLTGQWMDVPRLTTAAHRQGAVAGWDLAHAAGNVPLRLHDWNVDFAAWCSYKYLNAGPGSIAGCFVHERHAGDDGAGRDLPRLAGWWGNDAATRFRLEQEFTPRPGADGWQLSNPPILAMAPLCASLAIFDQAGMERLREKSVRLTGYLEYLLGHLSGGRVGVITPADPGQRGCQLSLRCACGGKSVFPQLARSGVVADFRDPDVVRVAPVPLYNTFEDCWELAHVVDQLANE